MGFVRKSTHFIWSNHQTAVRRSSHYPSIFRSPNTSTVLFLAELDGAGAQAALILVTGQGPDIGSSTSGAINSGFFSQCFPTLFRLLKPTILSVQLQFWEQQCLRGLPCRWFAVPYMGRISKIVKKRRILPVTDQLISAVKLSWNWNCSDVNVSALSLFPNSLQDMFGAMLLVEQNKHTGNNTNNFIV